MPRNNLRIKVGTYAGDGNDSRSISGVGFEPDFVLIKGGAQHSVWRTKKMIGDQTAYNSNASANLADSIQQIMSDGFQVGTSATANAVGTTYHYIAIKGLDGQKCFAVGQYFGNGANDRDFSVGGVSFTPDIVMTKRNGASAGCFRTSTMVGDLSAPFGTSAFTADYVQSLITNGFQLGTDDVVNNNASYYNFLALKSYPGVVAVGSYAGDGNDNREITGVGFQPDLVIIKASTNINRAVLRFSTQTGDETASFANVALAENLIQSLTADGFQVGTANGVNAVAGTPVYHWIAIKAGDFNLPITRTAV